MKLGKHLIIISAFVAALGGFLFGFDTAVISGTTHSLKNLFNLNAASLGLTVSIALWGTIIGALFSGIAGNILGRKNSLKITGFLFFISALGCCFAWDWYSLVFFRFIGGLGVGAASVLGPMYIAEISPANLRGKLVGLFQFNIVFGILIAYFSNYIVGLLNLGILEWRYKLGIGAAPALLFFLLLLFIPESPRWLVMKNKKKEALEILTLMNKKDADKQFEEITNSIENSNQVKSENLFNKNYSFPIFLAISIAIFNQLSGINALLYYLNDIFAMAGFDKVSADIKSVIIGATNLLFTIIAMSVIDKIGRKKLLLTGSVGTAICLSGIAAILITNTHKSLLLYLLVGYIAFFAFSQGAVIWVYLSEIFPNLVRAKGHALGSFTHWFMCALVSWAFPVMAEKSGGYPFVFFAVMMIVQFFVVLIIYPETKNASLEEIQNKLLTNNRHPLATNNDILEYE
ncbi:MAG: sugar porter family MFS transporter [Candidatus Gastranaerophilales bacterium]|nr:sugar porter family MFS transporter [Candidatus Gastranaerophilales bacterium]